MRKDCIDYAKACKRCQKFGTITRVPASELNYILKPWPFKGWVVNTIGEINPCLDYVKGTLILQQCNAETRV